jgi:hypothetical protein
MLQQLADSGCSTLCGIKRSFSKLAQLQLNAVMLCCTLPCLPARSAAAAATLSLLTIPARSC